MFNQVTERIRLKGNTVPIPEEWHSVHARFGAIWIADGSTLEELRKKLKSLEGKGTVLGGKMMGEVVAFTHRTVNLWYTSDAKANDKTFTEQLLSALPIGGLLIFDLGFFKFGW